MITTMVDKVLSFVTSKFRLIIEYVLIGIVLSLCGIVACQYYQQVGMQKTITDTENKLGDYAQSNGELSTAVQTLMQQREVDWKTVESLLKDFDQFAATDEKLAKRLRDLEKRNVEVKIYLDTAIPDDLRRLLAEDNDSTDPGQSANGK